MLISKYGFTDVLGDRVTLDPSRIAAQVVSGIGFIGGGLIFVRRDAVRGLTTAAVVWLTAAVAMASGAGLPILAVLVTSAHFVVVFGYTPLAARLPRSRYAPSQLMIIYRDGSAVLRQVLAECTSRGFSVSRLSTESVDERLAASPGDAAATRDGADRDRFDIGRGPTIAVASTTQTVSVFLEIQGAGSVTDLAATLSDIAGVLTVRAGDENVPSE